MKKTILPLTVALLWGIALPHAKAQPTMDRAALTYKIKSLVASLNVIGDAGQPDAKRRDVYLPNALRLFDGDRRRISNDLDDGEKELPIKSYLENIILHYEEGISYDADLATLKIGTVGKGDDGRSYQDATVRVTHKGIPRGGYNMKRVVLDWKMSFVYDENEGWKIYKISKGGRKPAPRDITLYSRKRNGKWGFMLNAAQIRRVDFIQNKSYKENGRYFRLACFVEKKSDPSLAPSSY